MTRVAYLTSQYPALSHAFIEREIEAIRACGVDVETYSVRPCGEADLRSATMRAEAARTSVLRGSPPGDWGRALTGLGARRPDVLAAGLQLAGRSGRRSLRSKTWQLFYLAEAVLLYDRLRALGMRHVHAHFANVGADVARLTAGLGRAEDGPDAGWRWSFTMHGPTEFEDVAGFDLAAKVRSADGVSCISDFCRSQLMRFVEPEHWAKLRVVHMAVDTRRYHPAPTDRLRPGSLGRLLTVGRLVPEKGAPVLLDALALLAERGLRPPTTLVGTGRSEAFVLPSFSEGLPVVLMEAMASGLPVITTQIAAIGELVQDRVNGRLVPPGRPDLLAEALADVLSDPGRARSWGSAGRADVCRTFSTQVTGPAMANFLADVAAGDAARGPGGPHESSGLP